MMRANAFVAEQGLPGHRGADLALPVPLIDHLHRAMDGKPGEQILASCAALELVGLCFYDSGARSIYAGTNRCTPSRMCAACACA